VPKSPGFPAGALRFFGRRRGTFGCIRAFAARQRATGLILGTVAIAAVSLVIAALDGVVDPVGLTALYLLAIVPVAIGWGFLPAGVVTVAAFLTYAYFFAPPVHSFNVDDPDTAAALVISLVTAYVVSALARRAAERARDAQLRAEEAERAGEELHELADEQEALRRVATLVAQGGPTGEVLEAVTREVGLQCAADLARMERFEPDGTVTAVAAWSRSGEGHLAVGTRFALEGASIAAQVRESGRPARVDSFVGASGPIAREAQAVGIRSSVGCPIVVGGQIWGVIAASTTRASPFERDTESRIADFTELAATAIANAEARDELRRVADEQAALREVATLVAEAAPPGVVFAAVAEEAGKLLSAGATALSRFDSDEMLTIMASWSPTGHQIPQGTRHRMDEASVPKRVRDTGRPARVDHHDSKRGARLWGPGLELRSIVAVPITVEGGLWGVMVVASTGDDPPPPGTEDRLSGFTELVATAIADTQSRAELQASRARIVATADETRRRIERDLHDGAQQRLVSLALELRGAQARVPPELPELATDLDQVAAEITEVLDELREMSRGLHPPILAKGGLEPALKTLARRSTIPVDLDVRTEGRLPQSIEVGAYYVVSEALTNAAKHAQASSVTVDVDRADGVLNVSVRDDGVGGADFSGGSGLVGLKDRVEALGGRIRVDSARDGGTAVQVELPLSADVHPSR
jgi:signal transduction histidine kinase